MAKSSKAPKKTAKKRPQPKQQTTTFGPYRGKSKPLTGTLFLVLGIISLISLILFDFPQSSFAKDNMENIFVVGKIGEYIAFYSLHVLGVSAWIVWLLLFWLSYLFYFRKAHQVRLAKILSIFCFLLSLSIFGTLIEKTLWLGPDASTSEVQHLYNDLSFTGGLGGTLGDLAYGALLEQWLAPIGTTIVVGALLVLSLIVIITGDLATTVERLHRNYITWRSESSERKALKQEERQKKRAEAEEAKRLKQEEAEGHKEENKQLPKPQKKSFTLRGSGDDDQKLEPIILEDAEEDIIPSTFDTPEKEPKLKTPIPELVKTKSPLEIPKEDSQPKNLTIIQGSQTRKVKQAGPSKKGNYIFPNLDLLTNPPERNAELDKNEHEQTAGALVQTLKNFNVSVTMGEVHTGPVITRYEVVPTAGVKVNKILGLENDIALGLKAMAVRIQAPVPGKGCVGIEVPNKNPEAVFLRDLLESEDWVKSKAEIPIALGKEVSGRPLIADLTKMPHLLIAGATGSGKTVCINTIIASLLYHSSPEDLRFIMVDPKIVEMQAYNSLPHMMIPVVTDPKKVPQALKWLIGEMERRYHIFAKIGVRNIAGFNDKQKAKRKEEQERKAQEALDEMKTDKEEDILGLDEVPEAEAPEIEVPRDEQIEIPEKLPYIVCIIDELADLMMVAQADVETGIARLAQLARAAGIHLIIATQRPSVNVITGIIKANLPSRIAFQVSSKVDSRTILDAGGAEQLIGRGDMLFSPPDSSKMVRSQGCFVSDDEINHIVEFLKKNGPPQFFEEMQRSLEAADEEEGGAGGAAGPEDGDEMYPQALDVLRATKRASTSMLQRRLRIGYNRAARIMEMLEDQGIVGPDNGSQPREILVDLDSL